MNNVVAQKDNTDGGANDDDKDGAEDDAALFRRAMADTNRSGRNYRRNRHPPDPEKSPPKPAVRIRKPRPAGPRSGGGVLIDKTDQGDYVEFARGGLQKRIMRRLKRGDYECTATLDLHGCTTAEAEPLLTDFLLGALDAGDSALLIIHGKGLHSGKVGGVLKQFTLGWLKAQSR